MTLTINISEETPIFSDYEDALHYINVKQKEIGKNIYLSSDEYKKIYPIVKKLYDVKKELNHQKTRKDAEKAMNEAGVSFNDKVEYTYMDMFMGANHYTGIVINKNGIPYVKYDKGLEDMKGNRSGRWHKGWRKAL